MSKRNRYIMIRVFVFKQKTAYEMRISDWSSDVCSSDLMPDIAFFRTCIDASFADLVKAAPKVEAAKTSKAKPKAKAEAPKPAKTMTPGKGKKKPSSSSPRT